MEFILTDFHCVLHILPSPNRQNEIRREKILDKNKMVRHLSLESALPILESKKETIVLLTSQMSLMEVVKDPTPKKILNSCKKLHSKAEQQDYFKMDYWGESVTKRSKTDILKNNMLEQNLKKNRYDDRILAGMMNVSNRISSMNGNQVDFFDIRG